MTEGRTVDMVVDFDADSDIEFVLLSIGNMFLPLGSL